MIIKSNQMYAKFITLDTQLSNGEEIATTTKEVYPVGSRSDSFGETYPIRELIASNGASYKCLPVQILDYKICSGTHCGDEIFWNTHKKFIYPVRESTTSNGASCQCKKVWVDGCEFTPLDNFISNGEIVRVGGNEEDRKMITK